MAQSKKRTRSTSRLLALEPRLLFDGAAMVAAQDVAYQNDAHTQDGDKQGHASDSQSERSVDAQKSLDFDGSFASVNPVNVVVIDSRVPDLDSLVADLEAGGAQVHVVQANESGLTAISNALALAQNADSLHIISHGNSGSITLGSDTINSATLQAQSAQVQDWAYYLTQDADILLYGCDVAAGEQGQAFIQELAYLSSADIAASTDATGAAALGGNWALERQTGDIESKLALSAAAMEQYSELLPNSLPKTTTNGPSEILLGSDFSFNVSFSNKGSATGYGPYIDVILPSTGSDGNDGITYDKSKGVTYLGQQLEVTEIKFDSNGKATHPYAVGTNGAKLILTGKPGDTLLVIELPFGSYSKDQPVADIVVNAKLSDLADTDKPLSISVQSGFMYGDTAVASDYASDPSIRGNTETISIKSTEVQYSYGFSGAENETASGPSFPKEVTVSITPAPGQTLTDHITTIDLPDGVVITEISGGSIVAGNDLVNGSVTSGNKIQVKIDSLSGTQDIKIQYYVAETYADGSAIIDPATGATVTKNFDISSAWTWVPKDIRDKTINGSINPAGAEVSHKVHSMAVQKDVTGDPRPGQDLTHTIDFQISDFFDFKNLVITDTIDDGLTPKGSAMLEVKLPDGRTITIDLSQYTGSKTISGNDNTELSFDISSALQSMKADYPELADGKLPGGSTGKIVYKTSINNTFKSPADGGDPQINHGDTLGSSVNISGSIVKSDGSTDLPVITDTTQTSTTVTGGALNLDISKVNGGNPVSSVKPGDSVTWLCCINRP